MNEDQPPRDDAIISIESTAEWQVHDILYDGQERYVAPLTFTDYVAKYARKVDWKKLVGAEISADDRNDDDEEDDEDTAGQVTSGSRGASTDAGLHALLSGSKEKMGVDETGVVDNQQRARRATGDAVESAKQEQDDTVGDGQRGVGPWDSVAKRLLQSLTEMNVLLDAIQVARNGKYLVLDPVQQEAPEQPKNGLLAAKKKALTAAGIVLSSLADQMRPRNTMGSAWPTPQQVDPELEELMDMRKHWRLKKVGNSIIGDLSHLSTSGYRPNATFEAKKVEKTQTEPSRTAKGEAWEVVLPKDLEEVLRLRVSLEDPNSGQSDGMVSARWPAEVTGGGTWREKLRTAQRTLFALDLFAQLAREAAHVPDLCCTIRGKSIVAKVGCDRVIRISLESVTASDQDTRDDSSAGTGQGAFVLEHNLQQLFDAELEGVTEISIPRPVTAPLTHLSKKTRLAGPDGLSVNCLMSDDASEKLLIQRVLDQASHSMLYEKCKAVVDQFVATCNDPAVSVHWCPETTSTWSMVTIQMATPFYEFCGKTVVMLEIGVGDVRVTLKDGEVVTVRGNLEELAHFLQLRARQHMISAVGTLCRPHQWHTLYSSPTHVDQQGQPAPAILIGHPAGTSAVFVEYPVWSEPRLFVQRLSDDQKDDNDEQRLLCSYVRNQMRPCLHHQLPGSNFLHKIELLVASLT